MRIGARPVGSPRPRSWPRLGRTAALTFINVGVFLLLLIVAEGLLSVGLFAWDVLREGPDTTRLFTRHDPELGWVPRPDVDIPDMYGPNVYLRTNKHGFRGNREVTATVPLGRRRVICSGDSVAFGHGVDDDHSWCRLLESFDGRLETVNMAVPAYGFDQAYLWYKRDGALFQLHAHVFAAITEDFRRMQVSRRLGYEKPFLALDNDALVVKNVPVPARGYHIPWLTESLRHIGTLRATQALQRIKQRLYPTVPAIVSLSQAERDERTMPIVSKVLEDLKRVNDARSSRLIFVYLPTLEDRRPDTDLWSAFLDRECRRLGVPFINLTDELGRLPDRELASLYLDLAHFNAKGNQYVAKRVYQRLREIPGVLGAPH